MDIQPTILKLQFLHFIGMETIQHTESLCASDFLRSGHALAQGQLYIIASKSSSGRKREGDWPGDRPGGRPGRRSARNCLELLGTAWTRLDPLGPAWTRLEPAWNPLGPAWTCLELLGPAWTCLELLGPAWNCLDLLGSAWNCLDLLGPAVAVPGDGSIPTTMATACRSTGCGHTPVKAPHPVRFGKLSTGRPS